MKETWKPVPGYEGLYEVSDQGRVRSLDRIVTDRLGRQRRSAGRILKPSSNRGYRQVILKHDGRNKLARVHRLVMLAFAGEPPEGHEVNHIDGNKANNSYLNLEYVTRAENVRHAVENGLMNGASNGKRGTWSRRNQTRGSKLTIAQVREIRQLRAEGVMVKDIAQMYGVHRTLVSLIVNRHIWLHA